MKYIYLTIIILFVLKCNSYAQLHDTTLIKKLSINGICLCQTTITSLKQSNPGLKETNVEEMDLAVGCYGQDERFISGKGYFSANKPGIIFQKEQDSDYVSKIRLTRQFKGNLPNGGFVDLSDFRLKDLFKIYPQFRNDWKSRGCSKYWKFSDDTIAFYVKIDTTKKKQFPIDEAYYLDKPIEAIDLMISCRAVRMYDKGCHMMDSDPVFFMDSVRISRTDLSKMDPDNIALVSVIKDTTTLKNFGPDAKDGLIYIETKTFAKHRYKRYFSSKSVEYAKIIMTLDDDSSIQYILNKKVLKENFEGDLASINDKNFTGIQLISKEQLSKDYEITDKDYGVIINSTVEK